MPSLAHKTERVLNLLRQLPPAKVNEVIDFAEYLKAKSNKTKLHKQNATKLPTYHMGAVAPDAFERSSPSDVAQKHDQWVRSQVEEALIVADNPLTEFIPHEAISSRWNEKKKALQACVNIANVAGQAVSKGRESWSSYVPPILSPIALN